MPDRPPSPADDSLPPRLGLEPHSPLEDARSRNATVIGWREWVGLPDLHVRRVKAKIDTGARSSSLHAFDVDPYHDETGERVRFSIHPVQFRDDIIVQADAPILERRHIRSSNGEVSERIVIRTQLEILRRRMWIDLTLANRDAMGFRMLVGREAIRERFLVDPAASYLAGKRRRRRRDKTPPAEPEPDSRELGP